MTLALYNVLAAAYMVIAQAIDLHTTSEGLKHKVAREDNDNLAALNAEGPHAKKFWILTAAKIVGAGCSVLIAAIAWLRPEFGALAAVLNTILAIYYTRILITNWQIYKWLEKQSVNKDAAEPSG